MVLLFYMDRAMEIEEAWKYIDEHCRDADGRINSEWMKITIESRFSHLPRYMLYGQLVYNPNYDLQLKMMNINAQYFSRNY